MDFLNSLGREDGVTQLNLNVGGQYRFCPKQGRGKAIALLPTWEDFAMGGRSSCVLKRVNLNRSISKTHFHKVGAKIKCDP